MFVYLINKKIIFLITHCYKNVSRGLDVIPILYFCLNVHAYHHEAYFKSRIVL